MTSASDWTFCWKLNAPVSSSSSTAQSKSKRKRPPPTNAAVPVERISNSNNGASILIMDNIKLPFAETWCGSPSTIVEPKKKTAKPNSATKFHQTVASGNQKFRPTTSGKQPMNAQERQEADQFIAGMMQRVELDLFGQDFIQRNPSEFTAFTKYDLRRTQSHPAAKPSIKPSDDYFPCDPIHLLQPKKEAFPEDDYLNLVATPESGGSNISGDEYSPAVTPNSTSDQSFLHFLNDDTLPLEISGLMEGCYGVESSQELFNCDPSWLSCFDA